MVAGLAVPFVNLSELKGEAKEAATRKAIADRTPGNPPFFNGDRKWNAVMRPSPTSAWA